MRFSHPDFSPPEAIAGHGALSLCFRGFLLRHFALLPLGVRVVVLHLFGGNLGLLAKIPLVHHSLSLTMNVITPDDRYSAG